MAAKTRTHRGTRTYLSGMRSAGTASGPVTRAELSTSERGQVNRIHDDSNTGTGLAKSLQQHLLHAVGICKIPSCGRPHDAHGLCHKHYQRLLKHGDPTICLRAPKGSGPKRNQRPYKVAYRDGRPIRRSRLVWEETHGPVPLGHHIHHKNHDPLDDRIENLECLPASVHLHYHAQHRRHSR